MKRLLLRIAAGILVLASLGVVYFTIIYPLLWRRNHLNHAIQVLRSVAIEGQRDKAPLGWGMTMTYPDGSWLAVYYADSHVLMLPSIAVARDSENHWFKSEVHYCGLFKAAERFHEQRLMESELIKSGEMTEDERAKAPGSEEIGLATSVLGASDLTSARGFLMSLGFERFTPSQEESSEQ